MRTHTAALALLVGAVGAAPVAAQTLDTGDTEVIALAQWQYEDVYADGMSAERLIDEMQVYDTNGQDIGDVEDLIATKDGTIVSVIAEVGGVWDIGDTHVSVPWSKVNVGEDGVTVPVTEETIEDYGLFDGEALTAEAARGEMVGAVDATETGSRAFRLSELIGDYARLRATPEGDGSAMTGGEMRDAEAAAEQNADGGADQQTAQTGGDGQAQDNQQAAQTGQAQGGEQTAQTGEGEAQRGRQMAGDGATMVNYGYVRDVIIKDGKIAAVVVNPDIGYGAPGYYTAYPYYGDNYQPGGRYYDLPYTPGDVAGMDEFEYEQIEAM